MPAETENGISRIQSAQIPPMAESGMAKKVDGTRRKKVTDKVEEQETPPNQQPL